MTHTTDTGAQEWSDERIANAVRRSYKVHPHGLPQTIMYDAMCEVRDDLRQTIATQAARIDELEAQVKQSVGVYREVMGAVLPDSAALAADNERLRAELAQALDVAIARGVQFGYEDESYHERYTDLTGQQWIDEWEEGNA